MKPINDRDPAPAARPDDERIRAVLQAAADPAPPHDPPPFFASRIRARAGIEGQTAGSTPVAVAAARLLPVFGVIAMLLVGLAGFESARFEREREAAVARAMATNGGGDVLLGAMLLGGSSDDAGGGSR